jgi:hypothetical protein
MLKRASILACGAVIAMFSLGTLAVADEPIPTKIPTKVAAPRVKVVKHFCGRGYYRDPRSGVCWPYAGPQMGGLPYVGPPEVRLPYLEPPGPRLPYVELPVRLPYVAPPEVRLPYVELPVRLPYVEAPAVRLPYVEPPAVGLPYVDLPVLAVPHYCPDGYSYYPARGRCIPI